MWILALAIFIGKREKKKKKEDNLEFGDSKPQSS